MLKHATRPLLIVKADAPTPVESWFARVFAHIPAGTGGAAALEFARNLAACSGGELHEYRSAEVEALRTAGATAIVAAMPFPATGAWLSQVGEPLVQHGGVPVLFVPERSEGASHDS